MSECLPDLPRYIRQRDNEWQGADHPNGPWRSIPAPQSGLPWMKPAATEESSAPQPTPLSPSAQAVKDAALSMYADCNIKRLACPLDMLVVAAALRAIAKNWAAEIQQQPRNEFIDGIRNCIDALNELAEDLEVSITINATAIPAEPRGQS